MSTFSYSHATGETIDADDVNNVAKAVLAILGSTNDNDGDPMLARSLSSPFSVRGSDANLAGKAIGSGGNYTVTAGLWFVITGYVHATTVTDTVTPSGGAAITLSSASIAAGTARRRICLILGAGDNITLGVGSSVIGFLMTAPSDLTRILQAVDNSGGAMTYTVATGKIAVLTFAGCVAANTGDALAIDSVAFPVGNPGGASTDMFVDLRVPLKATQAVTGAQANDILISGWSGNA